MTISTKVHDLRPDGVGGIWARVIVDVPLPERPELSDAIDINLHLPGAASLTFSEAEQRAKRDAHALLKRVTGQG
jgi:hypothetical protein